MHYLLVAITLGMASGAAPAAPLARGDALAAPVRWDDPPKWFDPVRPRNERDHEALDAAALFAYGRLLVHRGDLAEALRCYQRAWRNDPDSAAILSEIVPLAFRLNRRAEAARYAVIAAEKNAKDPLLLARLAIFLTRRQDFGRALKLYEMALELRPNQPPDARTVMMRLEMGRLYLLTGKTEKSARAFALVRDVLEHPDRSSLDDAAVKQILGEADRTYALLGESFLLAGRLDDAEAMFEKANDAKPNDGLLAWRLARIDEARGDARAAREKLDACFQAKLSQAGAGPYRLLAKVLGELSKDEQESRRRLIELLDSRYRNDPSNATLGYFLADTLRDSNELDRAEQLYSKLLQSRPAADAYQGLADIYRRLDRLDQLLDLLGQVAVQAGSLQPLGRVRDELASDPDGVRRLLDRARRRRRGGPPLADGAALAAALLAIEVKDYDAADEFYERALLQAAPPKGQVMVSWGVEMMLAGQYDRAARAFQRAIAEDAMPDKNPTLYLQWASALEQAGKADAAVNAAKKAAALAPDSPTVQSGMALILYRAKRYDEAEKHYLRLLERFDDDYESDDVRADMLQARMILSNLCVLQERLPEAEEWLAQVLDEYPEDIGALNDLGYLWADQGKHARRAVDMTRRAVEGEPDNAAYRDSLGWAYYRLGRYVKAVVELEKAAQGDDPDGVILDHLGDAYWDSNQPEKAAAAWRRALDALTDDENTEQRAKTKAKIRKTARQQPRKSPAGGAPPESAPPTG